MKRIVREPQLAKQAAEHIRGQLLKTMKAGTRLPPVRQLAKMLGVSVPIVLAAEGILEQEGWVSRHHGRGVFARQKKKCFRMGILSELDLMDPRIGAHFRLLAGTIKRKLMDLGHHPHLYVGDMPPGRQWVIDEPTCPQFWDDIANGLLDGGIILNVPVTRQWNERVDACPIPLVGPPTGFETEVDHIALVKEGVKVLSESGCNKLAYIGSGFREEFLLAVKACGQCTCNEWVMSAAESAVRGSGSKAFQAIWTRTDEKPDGLLILDDMLFADAQLTMLEFMISVPNDLQIVIPVDEGALAVSPYPYIALVMDPVEEADIDINLLLRLLNHEHVEPTRSQLSFRTVRPDMAREQNLNALN